MAQLINRRLRPPKPGPKRILILVMFFWVCIFSQSSIAQNDIQKTPEFFYEQAVKFHSNGQYKSAIEYYTKTIESDPDHVDAY